MAFAFFLRAEGSVTPFSEPPGGFALVDIPGFDAQGNVLDAWTYGLYMTSLTTIQIDLTCWVNSDEVLDYAALITALKGL